MTDRRGIHACALGLGLGLGLAATTACDRQAPPPEPPAETGPPPASTEAGPPDVKHTYMAAAEDEDEPPVPETDAPPTTAPPAEDVLTVDAAATLVSDAVDAATDPYAERLISPALPPSWPLAGSELVYYVYPLEPEEQGVARYRAFAPAFVVRLDVATRTTAVEPTPKTKKKIGTFEHPRVRREDAETKAEQALLDLAAGRVDADKVRYLLHGYGKWFDRHGKIGSDAETRAGAFAEWARAWGQR